MVRVLSLAHFLSSRLQLSSINPTTPWFTTNNCPATVRNDTDPHLADPAAASPDCAVTFSSPGEPEGSGWCLYSRFHESLCSPPCIGLKCRPPTRFSIFRGCARGHPTPT